MPADDRDVLEVLKAELNFLEKGGYGRSPREPWHAPLIFEDSPTCMNYDSKENPQPCEDCLLARFVEPEDSHRPLVCRYIRLNAYGDALTLESLYHWGSQQEIEDAMRKWLVVTIARLEMEGSCRPSSESCCGASPAAH